ncbi:PQ-loop repeat-containing protein [Candidatus Bathyarchaeota archaeon]|nr:PQ-loop repeat-containing protein [Candidatus Bathyarchaeota archaeon]
MSLPPPNRTPISFRHRLTNGANRYWHCLLYLTAGLLIFQFTLSPWPAVYTSYSSLIGYVGLGVEAILPLPQILANKRAQSCRGFRVSILVSWIGGDAMKMIWLFTSDTTIPAAFKVCGVFQACCDAFLGVQYLMYGEGGAEVKEHPIEMFSGDVMGARLAKVSSRDLGVAPTLTGRYTPTSAVET